MKLKITPHGYFAILLFAATLISLLFYGANLIDDAPLLGLFFSLALTSLFSAGTLLFSGVRRWLEEFAKKHIFVMPDTDEITEPPKYADSFRVFLYGLPGSGKTSLIESLLTVHAPQFVEYTKVYDVYENEVTVSLKPLKKKSVAIADYKGHKPSQIKVNPPEDFFGTDDDKKINAILFVVDLFPRLDDGKGKPLTPDETKKVVLASYKDNALKQIKKRVKDTEKYISEWSIEEVFTVAYSKTNLQSVRLVINKHDILKAIVEAGYISGVSASSLENFTLKCFSEIENNIRSACKANNISDFTVCILSAATKENIDSIFGNILK